MGFGGTDAEIYADTASAVLPLNASDVWDLLRSLRGWPKLDGYRGRTPSDVSALVEAILRVCELVDVVGDEIEEIEINPLIVHDEGSGVSAVDFMLTASAEA